MTSRRYCYRTGKAAEMGDSCPMCGRKHEPLPDQTRCWHSVPCPAGNHTHGCPLEAGHTGQCKPPTVCDRERGR